MTEGVAGAAAGTFVVLRALPWVVAWGGLRLVSGAARRLAGRRADPAEMLADAERAAAHEAQERLEQARKAERARAVIVRKVG